jgi:hypothetical protein
MSSLDMIDALAQVDPDGAAALCDLAAVEALWMLVERDHDTMTAEMVAEAVSKNAGVRRELVRAFIDARVSKGDVSALLEGAVHLTELDYEIAKADGDPFWLNEPRNHGKWTKSGRGYDVIDALATKPGKNGYAGMGQAWNGADRYDKARTLAQGLSAGGQHGPALAAAVYGTLGPEAEDVFGRSLRRGSYRYRGTERRPDALLKQEMNSTNKLMTALKANDPRAQAVLAAHSPSDIKGMSFSGDSVKRPTAGQPGASWAKIALFNSKQRGTTDQHNLSTRADVATEYLMEKVPSLANANLSMQAGKVPPSQGVLIDRDGDVVSQAVGFNGDHYLPFDLKNLKRLHGGQYVRTRVMGGPTSEDLYTGLLTGARQMTVVSNSGVFNVEFDPDLRGGRRYNDKARQMIGRYQAILETIKDDKATVNDIPVERKKEAQNDPTIAASNFRDLIDQEKALSTFQYGDDDELEAKAHQMAVAEAQEAMQHGAKQSQTSPASIARNARSIAHELRSTASDTRYRTLKLDGEGYHRALLALQEEFPFYIRNVDVVPLEKWQDDRNLGDPHSGEPGKRTISGADRGFVGGDNIAYGTTGRRKAKGQDAPLSAKRPITEAAGKVVLDVNTKSWQDAPLDSAAREQFEDAKNAVRKMSGDAIDPSDSAIGGPGELKPAAATSAAGIIKWLGSSSTMTLDNITRSFSSLDDQGQEDMITTLGSLGAGIDPAFPDQQKSADAAGKQLATYLRLRKPYRQGDALETSESTAPLHDEEIASLGHVQSNYASYRHRHTGKDVLTHVAAYTGKSEAARHADIQTDINTYTDSTRNGDAPPKGLREKITAKHQAHAFLTGESLANKYGVPGGQGKGSPASEPAKLHKRGSLQLRRSPSSASSQTDQGSFYSTEVAKAYHQALSEIVYQPPR